MIYCCEDIIYLGVRIEFLQLPVISLGQEVFIDTISSYDDEKSSSKEISQNSYIERADISEIIMTDEPETHDGSFSYYLNLAQIRKYHNSTNFIEHDKKKDDWLLSLKYAI
ncbi:hypothetical protein Glove_505g18 [Diversispora epigaea]|uniref:Uncharacterized protein n=1 Tax=Diversispora epigaea TaxID=1348612 RepID=A0A397GGH0_9GLOM|nr:hypothetical protein Glove_505g18 [Diversispora epigaea]